MEEHYLEQENEDPMRSDNSDQGDDLNNDHKDIEMVVGRVQLSATVSVYLLHMSYHLIFHTLSIVLGFCPHMFIDH